MIYKEDIFISLVNIQIDNHTVKFSDSLRSYVVLEPNWLVNVTALTQFDFCERSLFNNRFSIQTQNEYMLMGNIIHEVFEDIMIGISKPKKVFFDSLNKKLKQSLNSKIFDFALLGLDLDKIESKVKDFTNLRLQELEIISSDIEKDHKLLTTLLKQDLYSKFIS